MDKKEKILIIEDNILNMELLKDILELHDYEVYTVDSGEEGIEVAINVMPHLILMDIALPGIDGIETTDRLKNNQLTKKIPIIAVTSSVMKTDRIKISEHGFADLIPKPINTRNINQIIRNILDRGKNDRS